MRTRVAAMVLTAVFSSAWIVQASDVPRLTATASSQRIQNAHADSDDLSRMTDTAMVQRFRRAGLLVPVPEATSSYYLHQVPARSRYLRPWARQFLTRLSDQFHARFGARLRVTALVRTARDQRGLAARNANAAAATGPKQSTHLTGATLDISKRFMTAAHVNWMRRVLIDLRDAGVLYALEEFSQPCFHIMVYRQYDDYVRERVLEADAG
jgi:hypothetical protein